jgi:methionine-S-sulfoxide reductase
MILRTTLMGIVTMVLGFGGWACSPTGGSSNAAAGTKPPEPAGDTHVTEPNAEPRQAVFAGGCFWCTEGVFEQIQGVSEVVSGYAGGQAENATYRKVASGRTDHAECVRVTYDPAKVTYGKLLQVFFATHDPTQLNRQGPDTGRQYRSAVFYADDEQKQVAEQYIQQLKQTNIYHDPIVTTLEPLNGFHVAEDNHQDFVENNPQQGYVQTYALPKIKKVRKMFPETVR